MGEYISNNRILSILDAISNGNEMDVPLMVTTYSGENPFPQKSKLLLFRLSLHRLDLLLIRRLASIAIKKQLGWINIQFIPGFKCFYGNIHAGGVVSLCDTIFVDYANIFIGAGTGFSYQNMVITSNHDMSSMDTIYAKEIVIGQNVWIGSRVTILGGVHIGQNTVIGAGSVVTKDIPPNVFAAGMPAKPIYEINREPFRKRS